MKIKRLTITDFRNIRSSELELSDGVNIIYGSNGQGKTNILESIWMFTGGHSFRASKDSELINFDSQRARLEIDLKKHRHVNMAIDINSEGREFTVNGVHLQSAAMCMGEFKSVVFSPEQLSAIKGGPAFRRSMIDAALCQCTPAYTKEYASYKRILKQRNSLLKDIAKDKSLTETLPMWDALLAERGMKIIDRRKNLLETIRPFMQQIFRDISGGREDISIRYASTSERDDDSVDTYFEKLVSYRSQDIMYGCTNIGPHRDDIEFLINGRSLRSYGSQGQQRSAVIAFKLAEADAMQKITGEAPVILLDDVMSELDSKRQEYILRNTDKRQIIITCCEPGAISTTSGNKLFNIENGEVVRCIFT